jgi:hypothetical protein
MTDNRGAKGDRRRVGRGGRRATDLSALSPALQAEATEYANQIAECSDRLTEAIDGDDLIGARDATKTIRHVAERLQLLLATGHSMRGA